MKVSLYEGGGRLEGGFTIPGMTLTGPLLLSGKVTSPSEAVHKQYVDTAMTNLSASNFIAGTIAPARLPALSGDIITTAGSSVVTLAATGVIAGDYTKVTVDSKGRTSTGLSLTEADLPNLSWNKFTLNKPTTIAGYGITDGVSTVNGTITGNLTLNANPTTANQAATKAYADSNVSTGAKIVTGDIVTQVSSVGLNGFLRCNGGVLNKTTYSALYAVIGDTFSGGNNYPGAGQPWAQQYAINSVQKSVISNWVSETPYPISVSGPVVLVTKNRVYLFGGNTSGGYVATSYTAAINSDGSLGAWTSTTAFSRIGNSGTIVATKNRVYSIGVTSGTNSSTVYTAPINADGTIGTWVTATALPAAISAPACFITRNYLYVIFGATAYFAYINSDGTLGVWETDTGVTGGWTGARPVVTKNRVYLLGGGGGGYYRSEVITAPINADGKLGLWTSATSMPAELSGFSLFVTKERVYVFGGHRTNAPGNLSGHVNNATWSAAINSDGTLGSWRQDANLPQVSSTMAMFATSSKLYMVGGISAISSPTYYNNVYSASIVGGLNDYTSYFDGSFVTLDANTFRLPDYSLFEKTAQYYFIKT